MSTKVEISKRVVLINSAGSIAARILSISVLLWLQPYLLGRISTDEYSLYPVVMSVMVFAPLLTSVLTGGIGRFVVEAYARGDTERVTQIASTMFPLLLAAGLAVLGLGGLFSWYIDQILSIPAERTWDARLMMLLLMGAFAISLPLVPFQVGMYVRQRFVLQNLIDIGQQLLWIGLLFVLLFTISTRVLWVVVASSVSAFVIQFVRLVISRRLVPTLSFHPGSIRWSCARDIVSFGVWNFVIGVADAIRNGADPLILCRFATSLDVTCFHLGRLIFRQVQMARNLVTAPLAPPLIAMEASGDKERLRNAYLTAGRYALWGGLSVALPAIVYGQEFMTAYVGEEYHDAAVVMGLLLIGFPLALGNVLMDHLARARGELGPLGRRVVFVQMTNLGLTLYLVGVLRLGAIGSALSTIAVAVVSQPLLLWPLALKMVGLTFEEWARRTLWPGFLPGIGGIAVWVTLRAAVHPSGWATLGACTAGGMALYVVVLFVFALQPYDRAMLAQVRQRLGWKRKGAADRETQ